MCDRLGYPVAASFAFGPRSFQDRIITGMSSPLVITVPDDHFLKINEFFRSKDA